MLRRARVRQALDDLPGALADLDRAHELAPDAPGAYSDRGDILRFACRHEEAIAAYDTALTLDPDLTWAWGSRALSLEALERVAEAVASLDEALRIDPGYGWAREQRERMLGAETSP
ncbi:hypothetical protein DEJ49_15350 [Streptomyces venezuelae]|uniref:Tetratricopeptide repeat protein n=1 Tax=Streptomyces venezuelae TaxID=54571 RepID=A0A5P2CY18_STRVZ|nr:hypothetical protein DEJ49_15350 [Streptomyces venezuelae]